MDQGKAAPMTRQQAATTAMKDADAVYQDLQAALKTAGITLPSLGVDPVSFADRTPRPLIELGRCNVETARKLTVALAGGRTRSPRSQR
jgi:hypothetical protein